MLTELCQELKNWFEKERYSGEFKITGGVLDVDFLLPGQFYRIMGSVFNDGVHKKGDYTDRLLDETFTGAVWALGIPQAVVELSQEIDAWREKYEAVDSAAMSPYQSESFGGYSYSKGAGGQGSNAANTAAGWKGVFAGSLNRWRKL